MNNKEHTVTISGKEYLEYLKLKEIKNSSEIQNRFQLDHYQTIIKQEKANKLITIRLEYPKHHKNFLGSSEIVSSFDVHISSLDSIRQTKFLSKKIMDLIYPITSELKELKDTITAYNVNLRYEENKNAGYTNRIKSYNNLSWIKKLTTNFKV
jgi:hypothetical protein